jgi:hypothetical protein
MEFNVPTFHGTLRVQCSNFPGTFKVYVKFNVPNPWDGHSTTDSKARGKEALFDVPSHSGHLGCADQCPRYLGTLKHSVFSHFDNHSATNVPDILGHSQLNILYHLFPIFRVTQYILQPCPKYLRTFYPPPPFRSPTSMS